MPLQNQAPNESFHEKYNNQVEKVNETDNNGHAPFTPDANKNIEELAAQIFKNDTAEQERYVGKMVASIQNVFKQGTTVQDLWDAMAKKECDETAIIKGILQFMGKGKIIDISSMLTLDAHANSTIDNVYLSQKTEIFKNAHSMLADLAKELNLGNKKHPPMPSSMA